MTIANQANRNVDFPASFDWISHKTHNFKPRDLSDTAKLMVANVFLHGDKAFQHLLRQCDTTWLVALTFGVDTVYLNLYDPQAVDDPKTTRISSSINLKQAIMVEVCRDRRAPGSKTMVITPVTPERALAAAHTGPFLYSSRCLRPAEQQQISSLYQTIDEALPVSQSVLATA